MQTDTRESDSVGLRPKRRLLKSVLGVFGAAVLCLGAATTWLTATNSGLKTLVNWGQGPVATALGGTLDVSGVSGSLWHDLQIDSFAMSIPDAGVDVSAQDFRLRWRPMKLLGGTVRVDDIGASDIRVALSPIADSEPVAEDTGPFEMPTLPVRLDVRKIDFPKVTVSLDPQTTYVASLQSTLESQEDGTLLADLTIESQKDGQPTDTVNGSAQIGTGTDAPFTVSLTGHLPPDGLVWSLTGLEPALRHETEVSLDISGNLGNLAGTLSMTAQGFVSVEAKLGGDLASERKEMTFDGVVDLISGDAFGLPAALNGPKDVRFKLGLDQERTLTLDTIHLAQKDLVRADGSGSLSLDTDVVAGNITLSLSPQVVAIIDPNLSYQSAKITSTLSGTVSEPSLTAQADLGGVSGYDMALADLAAHLTVKGEEDGALTFETDVTGAGVKWPSPDLQQLVGSDVTLHSSGTIAPDFDHIGPFELTIAPLNVEASGSLALASDGAVTGENLRIRLGELAKLSSVAGIDLKGAVDIDLTGLGLTSDGGMSTQVKIAAQDLFVIDMETSDRIGSDVTLIGTIRRSAEGATTLELESLRANPGRVSGTLSLAADMETLAGTLTGTLTTQTLPPIQDLEFKSTELPFRIDLKGPVSAPQVALSTQPVDLRYQTYSVTDSQVGANLYWRQTVPVIDVSARASVNATPVTATVQVLAEETQLLLQDISVNGLDTIVTGTVTLPDYGLPATGSVTIDATSIERAASFAGFPGLQGVLSGTLNLSQSQGKQSARIDASLDRFAGADDSVAAGVTARSLKVMAEVKDALELSGLRVSLKGETVTVASVTLAQVDSDFSGGVDAGDVTLSLNGKDVSNPNRPQPISLTAAAGFSTKAGTTEVTLATLSGRYADIPLNLVTPSRVVLDQVGLKAVSASVAVANGQADIAYTRSTKDSAQATIEISKLPITPFLALQGVSDVAGTLNVSLTAQESAEGVTGTGKIDLSDIKLAALDQAKGLATHVSMTLNDGVLSATLTGDGPGFEKADMSAELPVVITLVQPGFALETDAPVKARAELMADLDKLWPLLPLPEHAVTGEVGIDAQISGTLDAPRITGMANLTDVAYENIELGTIVRHVTGRVRFEDRRIVVESLTGEDPAGSQFNVAGQGELAVDAARLSATVKAQNFQVIQNDAMKIWTDIDLSIRLADPDSLISGAVTVRKGEINLAVALPPSIPTLDVQEAGVSDADNKEQSTGPAIDLDIQIDLPGQVFVRGRGLDSEWQGNLKVEGNTATPKISGLLTAKRGKFDVIGKSFALENSTIRFLAGDRVDPILGIRGVYEADDLTVIARLAGPASKPEVILESQPSLPEDEILSRVLFGKTKGKLSAAEAVQLAASVSELSGGGSGLDILGSLRQFVGVDVLEVGAGDGGAEVKAGKYIADGVYVGAKQGSTPGSSSVEVEVEVTPNISVNTESGQTDSSVGVEFKWDY